MTRETPRSPRSTATRLALLGVGMFGFGYLMVPIYNVFCDITGLNGNTSRVKTAQQADFAVDESRTVRVQFVATLNQGMAWEFAPEQFEMEVHPGKVYTTHFVARNLKPAAMVGQAVPSVMPGQASLYFNKTECFCFTRQSFAGGERRLMPVSFVVDPKLPRKIHTVTLAYTFFDVTQSAGAPAGPAASSSTGG